MRDRKKKTMHKTLFSKNFINEFLRLKHTVLSLLMVCSISISILALTAGCGTEVNTKSPEAVLQFGHSVNSETMSSSGESSVKEEAKREAPGSEETGTSGEYAEAESEQKSTEATETTKTIETTEVKERTETTEKTETTETTRKNTDTTEITDTTTEKKNETAGTSENPVTSENPGTSENVAGENPSSVSSENDSNGTLNFDVDYWKFSNLPSEPMGHGVGYSVDDKNRPVDMLNIQKRLGDKYNTDYIMKDDGIYLTFTMDFENGYLSSILDTLRENNVPAACLVTISYAKNNPELMRRMIDDPLIEVGAHSPNSPIEGLPTLPLSEQYEDMKEIYDYIKDNYGYEIKLFSYMSGIYSEQSMALAKEIGYRTIFWSFAYLDYDPNKQPDTGWALQNAIEKIHPGAIYLLHSLSSTNAAILDPFIKEARNLGYQFKTWK